MIKIQLKNVFGEVVFEFENSENTIKKTVEAYLKKMQGSIIRNLDLSFMDLSGIGFDNSKFDNSKFYNSTFDNSKFDNSKFDNSTFYNSTFDNSTFYNSKFDNSTFDNSTFYNSKFYNSKFYNSKFDNSTFYNSTFYNSKFDNSTFYNSTFYNSTFYNSTFIVNEETVKNIISNNQQFLFDNAKDDFFSILLRAIPEIPGLRKALVDGKVDGSTYEGDCCCLVGTIANVKECYYKELQGIKPNSSRPAEQWFVHIKPGMTPENSEKVKLTVAWVDEFLSFLPK